MSQAKPNSSSNNSVIQKLSTLKHAFELEAGRFKGYADTLSQVITEIEGGDEKVKAEKLAKEQRETADAFLLKLSALGKPFENKNIIFLIDGSGSMMTGGTPSLIVKALDTAKTVHDAVVGMKDVNVNAFIWGMRGDIPRLPLDNADELKKYMSGLNCGSELSPAIDHVNKGLSFSGPVMRDTHVIIISDGYITDEKETAAAIGKLKKAHSKVTVDALLIGRNVDLWSLNEISEDLSKIDQSMALPIYVSVDTADAMLGMAANVLIDRSRSAASQHKKAPGGPTA